MSTEPANREHEAESEDAPLAALAVTGHAAIDAALAEFSLSDDVHAHHDDIAAVLDVVQQALNPTQQPPLPRR
ncbi:hypothetical protein ET989_08655 [Propioniciclava sinopodophylli]|uniref:Uncharacterized protein n=1 Tax=Propioniciclava sinopodophylli TaxID=1837344 RepID=A0A4Q9KDI3_9ACTN|nr:hypothetical protein [Propioniciclava sinopodophylli]TBT84714.1 hypothetical protein ET989_08655 [Propioniciclava sinopodophylli]